jgi:hypothetical protein
MQTPVYKRRNHFSRHASRINGGLSDRNINVLLTAGFCRITDASARSTSLQDKSKPAVRSQDYSPQLFYFSYHLWVLLLYEALEPQFWKLGRGVGR